MSSESPKMVGGRYGLAGNGLKWLENQEKLGDPRWPPCGAPLAPARVQGGWLVTPPTAQNPMARKWFKMTLFGSTCFGEFL